MWLVNAPSKANWWNMLLLKPQRVSHAAGLGGQGEDGWVGWRWACWLWNSRGFPSTGLCSPLRACSLPLLAAGAVQRAQTFHLNASDFKLAGWFPSYSKAANFCGPPRALGMISIFKENGQRAWLWSRVCGFATYAGGLPPAWEKQVLAEVLALVLFTIKLSCSVATALSCWQVG